MFRSSAWLGSAAAMLAACAGGGAGADFGGADASAGTQECFSSSECPVGWTCSELGVCVPPPPGVDAGGPPSEVEYKLSEPHASRRYVWVAMTDLDRLARIDGTDLEVTSIPVGDQPSVLATMPGTDTAVVLDSVNAAATVVRPTPEADAIDLFPTLPNLNRLVPAPNARYAVAYFDLAQAIADAGSLEDVTQVGSFQDVTVLALQPGAQHAVDLTVGFRPREVEMDVTGTYAFVVTDDGVSVIDMPQMTMGEPTIVPPIPVTSDPFEDPSGIEVDIVASGDYAVVRIPGVAGVRVVDMLPPGAGAGWAI